MKTKSDSSDGEPAPAIPKSHTGPADVSQKPLDAGST
jgi:hypothetical protein